MHTAPIRVGLVLAVNSSTSLTGLEDVGVAMLCAYNYVVQQKNPQAALSFLTSVLYSAKESQVTIEDIKYQLQKKYTSDYEDVLGEDSDYDFGRKLSEDFIQRTGLHNLPQALLNGVPLSSSSINVDDFEEAVLQEVMTQSPTFQKAIYKGKLTDNDDVFEYIMNQPNIMPRLNQRILNKDNSLYLDMTGEPAFAMDVSTLMGLSTRDMTATALENLKYFVLQKKTDRYHSTTYWIVGDLNCIKSRELLLAALQHLVGVYFGFCN